MVCNNCKPEFDKLLNRIKELEKRLSAYENAHTPHSKLRFPPRIINENSKLPGQKLGHKGNTRKKPDPTMTLEIIEEKCPHCRFKLGKPIKTTTKIIEEIPEPHLLRLQNIRLIIINAIIAVKRLLLKPSFQSIAILELMPWLMLHCLNLKTDCL